MAIDTENKRRSVFQDPFAAVLPKAGGSLGAGDRATLAFLYSGLAYTAAPGPLAPSTPFSQRPFSIVKLTIAGDVAGSQDFFFVPKEGPPAERIGIPLGIIARPYLIGDPSGRPVKIEPEKGVTNRARITATFAEDGDAPDFDPAVFSVISGGGFWRRLRVAQPDYIGSAIEVRRGFLPVSGVFTDLQLVFKGTVEGMDIGADGKVGIRAKDILRFRDVNQPAQISDSNLLDGAIISSDATITVDDGSEFTDPSTLPSKDFDPVTVQIESELVLVESISGDVLTVVQNHLDPSEEFNDAAWTKSGGTTITADSHYGPRGGLIADQIDFAAIGDKVEQDSGLVATGNHAFSVWIRSLAPDGVSETITIEIASSGGTETGSLPVTITNKWKRFVAAVNFTSGPETVVCRITRGSFFVDTDKIAAIGACLRIAPSSGFYAPTKGNGGADAGRGALGTTAASHVDNTVISEVIPYRSGLDPETGVHPVFALRDLINRGLVATADVDQTAFDDEFFFIPSTEIERSGTNIITESKRLSEHIKELQEQGLLDLWTSQPGLITTRLSFRQGTPGVTIPIFKDQDSIVRRSLAIRQNEESRFTRVVVHYDAVTPGGGDKSTDFNGHQIVVDLAVELASGPKVRTIFAHWITRLSDALALGGRLVARFFRSARIVTLSVDLKDEGLFDVGDVFALNSEDILRKSGATAVRFDSIWGTTQKKPLRREGKIQVEALEHSGNRQFIIAPSGTPDYDDATTEQRQYGFIGAASTNKVGTDAEDGYFII